MLQGVFFSVLRSSAVSVPVWAKGAASPWGPTAQTQECSWGKTRWAAQGCWPWKPMSRPAGALPAHPQPPAPRSLCSAPLSLLNKASACTEMLRWALGWESPIFPDGQHLNKPPSFSPAPVARVRLLLGQATKPRFGSRASNGSPLHYLLPSRGFRFLDEPQNHWVKFSPTQHPSPWQVFGHIFIIIP